MSVRWCVCESGGVHTCVCTVEADGMPPCVYRGGVGYGVHVTACVHGWGGVRGACYHVCVWGRVGCRVHVIMCVYRG